MFQQLFALFRDHHHHHLRPHHQLHNDDHHHGHQRPSYLAIHPATRDDYAGCHQHNVMLGIYISLYVLKYMQKYILAITVAKVVLVVVVVLAVVMVFRNCTIIIISSKSSVGNSDDNSITELAEHYMQ